MNFVVVSAIISVSFLLVIAIVCNRFARRRFFSFCVTMALDDGDSDNFNWRADPSGRARPLQNGNQGASRMPSMYGGEGETPVVERGVPLPASEVRAAGFGLFDPSSASILQVLTCFSSFFTVRKVFYFLQVSKFFS